MLYDRLPDKFIENIESIVNQDYNNNTIRRILNILDNIINSTSSTIKSILPNEQITLIKQYGLLNVDILFLKNNVDVIRKEIENDLLKTYLLFLQEFIDNQNYSKFKLHLIRSKYNTSFINNNVEKDMIFNNYEIIKTLSINSQTIAVFNKIDLEQYNLFKNKYSRSICTKQIFELIEINDMDYKDITKASISILRQCLIRSSFQLMDDNLISDINDAFHNLIKCNEYLARHPQNNISEQLIDDCFNSIKKDKNKINVIMLKSNLK